MACADHAGKREGNLQTQNDSRVFCLRPLKIFKKARDKSTVSKVVISRSL